MSKAKKSRDGERNRELLIQAIHRHPGIHKSALCRENGWAWGTVSYHIQILERLGEVKSVTHGKEVRYFPREMPKKHVNWIAALHEGVGASILNALENRDAEGNGSSLKDLSGALGRSRKVIRRHLAILNEEGLTRARGRVQPRYQIDPNAVLELESSGLIIRGEGSPPPPPRPRFPEATADGA